MAAGFPLYIDLKGNNCTIFGGGRAAASRVMILLAFGAKVTVISPELCEDLRRLDKEGRIRYIPRRYYRGDCSSSYLCVAATGSDPVNIAISDECKAKAIAVNVTSPAAFGTFRFPSVITSGDLTISIAGNGEAPDEALVDLMRAEIARRFPEMYEDALRQREALLRSGSTAEE
ncbi:MAG TPA: bifunctional precorrin-2 dehydrogenase/sirohydrochlorin ferrochelatase [Firmicutes bacterium]|nr:bifunctional precorrin-2 dehydrogenase/sirohydrochlorin ferrochelatase [Bacillota bacterium]